ncbi:hypothetical protein [Floridanema flaviceps]
MNTEDRNQNNICVHLRLSAYPTGRLRLHLGIISIGYLFNALF